MSNATYILGTVEYFLLEIEVTTPGYAFVPEDWTAELSLAAVGSTTRDVWTIAELVTIDERSYARVLLGDVLAPGAGKYNAYVRLTKKSGGTEIPLLKAVGTVAVEAF